MKYKIYVFSEEKDAIIPNEPIYCRLNVNSLANGIRQAVFDENDSEYVGILTNSRYFIRYELPVDEYYLDDLFVNCEMIVPYDGIVNENTVREQFIALTGEVDILDRFENVINKYTPEYTDAFKYCFSSRRIFTGNLVIAKREVLKKYYLWVDRLINSLFDNSLFIDGDRFIGWPQEYDLLVGWLLKVFICVNNIKSCSVIEYKKNPEMWLNADKKNELVQQYVDKVLEELVTYRKEYGFEGTLADDLPPIDFGGKIPVWACWWQGEDAIPEMPSICIDSIRRNLPDNTEIIIITLENVMEYVSFTPDIINKFNEGIITYTHMSDILRAELLYRYGGMWVDVTYYAPKKIPSEIFEQNFYSIGFGKRLWANDVMKGRWTLSMMVTPPKHPAVQFLMEGLWSYWDNSSELVDYYLIDFVFETGYKNFVEIKKAVDLSLITSTKMIDLQLRMNQRITDSEKKWLEDTSIVYKLNRKNDYYPITPEGDMTFYGYMAIQAGRAELLEGYDEQFCNQVRIIGCQGMQQVMDIIRDYNPDNILDYGLVFYNNGWINKGMLREMILHPFILTGVEKKDANHVQLPIKTTIYNQIISENDCRIEIDKINFSGDFGVVLLPEENEFDLIVLSK